MCCRHLAVDAKRSYAIRLPLAVSHSLGSIRSRLCSIGSRL